MANVKIAGYASTELRDSSADILLSSAFSNQSLASYKKNPVLLFGHDHKQVIGKVDLIRVVQDFGLWVEATVYSTPQTETHLLPMIRSGSLRGFSVSFIPDKTKTKWNPALGAHVISGIERLVEISVVSVPMNEQTIFGLDTEAKSAARTAQYRKENRLKCLY